MALQKSINIMHESGLSIPVENAYIKINSYAGNKSEATIYVNSYLSKQHCDDGKAGLESTKIFSFFHSVEEDAPTL